MSQLRLRLAISLLEAIAMIASGEEFRQRSADISAVTARIIKSCYGEALNEIGQAGNVSDYFVSTISSDATMSVVLLSSDKRLVNRGIDSAQFPNKLQVFAVTATSPLELKGILVDLRKTRWWNHMAQFYVFDPSGKGHECSRQAFDFLWAVWTMNILRGKFICNHDATELLIYTFNPYTLSAPEPWEVENIYRGLNDHPWALLVRKYRQNYDICKNIDLDEATNGGGYEFRVKLTAIHRMPDESQPNRFSRSLFVEKNLLLMQKYMNVSLRISYCSANESLGFVDQEGKGHGMLAHLTSGSSDMLYRISLWSTLTGVSVTYPAFNVYYFAVTQYTDYPTQLQKVLSSIYGYSRICLCVVILVNTVFLKYAMGQSFAVAVLNTLRMICNSCFTKLPSALGLRIYLACLLYFVLVMQALYQGQLAARLAKHDRFPNINNARDLINSDYVIYGRYNDSVIFGDRAFEGRFVGINNYADKCTNYVVKNSSIACVGGRDMLMADAIDSRLHMSRNPVLEVLMSVPLRRDCPFEERLNRHNLYYIESGLREYYYKAGFASGHRTLELNENGGGDEGSKVLGVRDLDFGFIILGIGLGCAAVSFAVELYVG